MATKIRLPRKERDILEGYGVIEAPNVPRLDLLEAAIHERGMGYRWNRSPGGTVLATVLSKDGRGFDGIADAAEMAVCEAFCQALVATQFRQGGLFGDGPNRGGGGGGDDGPIAPPPPNGGDGQPEPIDGEFRAIGPGSTQSMSDLLASFGRPLAELSPGELEEHRRDLEIEMTDPSYSNDERASINREIEKINTLLIPAIGEVSLDWSIPVSVIRPPEELSTQELEELRREYEFDLAAPDCTPETRERFTAWVADIDAILAARQVLFVPETPVETPPVYTGPPIGVQQMTPNGYQQYRNLVDTFTKHRGTSAEQSEDKLLTRKVDLKQRLASPMVRKRNVEMYEVEIKAIGEELALRAQIAGVEIEQVIADNGGTVEAAFGTDAFEEVEAPQTAMQVADDLMGQAFGGRFVEGNRVSNHARAYGDDRPEVIAAIGRRRPVENLERIVELERQLNQPDTRSHVSQLIANELRACRREVALEIATKLRLACDDTEGTIFDPQTGEIVSSGDVLSQYRQAIAPPVGDGPIEMSSAAAQVSLI